MNSTTTLTLPPGLAPQVLRQIEAILTAAADTPRPIAMGMPEACAALAGTRHFPGKAGGLLQNWQVGGAYPILDLYSGQAPRRNIAIPAAVVDDAIRRGPLALCTPVSQADTMRRLEPWPELLTAREAGEALGVGIKVIRSLIRLGLLPTRPGSRLTLIHRRDLAAFYVQASRAAVTEWQTRGAN